MPISGIAPFTVQFTDTTSGAPTSWLWVFGDGFTSTLQNPLHTYTNDGTYIVTLHATTPNGSVEQSDSVIVGSVTAAYTPPTEKGAGLPGDDPQVMLRISNDGGKTWITMPQRSAGKMGEYQKRVRWNRCGAARRRVWEISMTDPVAWKITGAYLTGMNGNGNGG